MKMKRKKTIFNLGNKNAQKFSQKCIFLPDDTTKTLLPQRTGLHDFIFIFTNRIFFIHLFVQRLVSKWI
jgi:hypothetical protein